MDRGGCAPRASGARGLRTPAATGVSISQPSLLSKITPALRVLNRLHEKGLITDPKSKAKSVLFTDEGLEKSQRLFERLFGRSSA